MKPTSLLLLTLLFAATVAPAVAATMGFAGTLEVQSVVASERKAIFVVSGPCELLLSKPSGTGGKAQEVASALDHAVIVLYRTHDEFPSDQAWQQACERFKRLIGGRVYFHTASPRYTLESGDVTLIVGEMPAKQSQVSLRVGVSSHQDCHTCAVQRSPRASPGRGRPHAAKSREWAGCSSTPPSRRSHSTHSGPRSFSPGNGLAWCAQ